MLASHIGCTRAQYRSSGTLTACRIATGSATIAAIVSGPSRSIVSSRPSAHASVQPSAGSQ